MSVGQAAGQVPGPTTAPSAATGPSAERRAGQGSDQSAAAAAFAAAIAGLREHGTPYHLAHGLLDHAQYQLHHGDGEAAVLAIDEARAIGLRLRCQPLLDRADSLQPAQQQIRT